MHFETMKFKQKPREEQLAANGTESKNYFEDMACNLFKSLTPGLLPFSLQLTSLLWFMENVEVNQQSPWIAVAQNYSLNHHSDVESLYLKLKSIR